MSTLFRLPKIVGVGLLFLCLWGGNAAFGQVQVDTISEQDMATLQANLAKMGGNKKAKNARFSVVPLLFYTPETRLAFGGMGMSRFSFHPKDSTVAMSQVSLSAVYTLEKQYWVNAQYQLQCNAFWNLSGEIGYFVFPYYFSGIGNAIDPKYRELYDDAYPVFDVKAYRKLSDHWYVGGIYEFQKSTVKSLSDSGVFNAPVPGSNGSTTSRVGLGLRWDTRNYVQNTSGGWFAQVETQVNSAVLGASYADVFVQLDARKFFTLSKKEDVLAVQAFGEFHTADIVFNKMAMLGGQNQMRGFITGVYRDQSMCAYQAEYRSRYFFKFLGLAGFVSLGGVGNSAAVIHQNLRWAYGGGLRLKLDAASRYVMRVDYAGGINTQALYIAVGQAF